MRLFLQIISIIVIVSTICICAVKPDMHKSVIVYNSDYKLVPETVETMEKEDIKIVEVPVAPQTQTIKKEVKTVNEPKTVKIDKPVLVQTKTTSKPTTKVSLPTTKTVPVQTKQTETVQKPVIKTESKTTTQPLPQKVSVQNDVIKQNTNVATQTLTPQQEEIAWNVWRSNLQNKIMQDAKLPLLPYGVVFKFSFTVDKYGKVSNVYAYSTNQAYTPYAVQYIVPVIRSYQGKSILNFPEGSTRTVTDVKGGWKLSGNERYSTPQDYNDVERIIK